MSEMPRSQMALNYHPCRYGSSKILFRGPAQKIRGDYISILGGTETFGRFIETPYPTLLQEKLGLPTINLGCIQAGIDAFINSPGLIDICSMSKATVIQILGAPNMSNRFYTVDPRHNERFMRASKCFKDIYPEVDFFEFERVHHMLTALARLDRERLPLVRHELQCAWVARMRTLLNQIDGKKVLLWVSDHAPYSEAEGGTICRDPLFIDRAMLNAVVPHADALVEVVATPEEIAAGRMMMVFPEFEHSEAQEMLGPLVHNRVRDALAATLADLVDGPESTSAEPEEPEEPEPMDVQIEEVDLSNLYEPSD